MSVKIATEPHQLQCSGIMPRGKASDRSVGQRVRYQESCMSCLRWSPDAVCSGCSRKMFHQPLCLKKHTGRPRGMFEHLPPQTIPVIARSQGPGIFDGFVNTNAS